MNGVLVFGLLGVLDWTDKGRGKKKDSSF